MNLPQCAARTSGSTKAFTLIELLVVLAILGIIGGLSVSSYITESRNAAVRQAAIQMQSDLEILRSSTIRYNGNSGIVLATGGIGYTLSIATGGAPRVVSKTFGNGVIAARIDGDDVTYIAPLSTTNNVDGLQYSFTLNGASAFLKVIGVTGRAIFSATN